MGRIYPRIGNGQHRSLRGRTALRVSIACGASAFIAWMVAPAALWVAPLVAAPFYLSYYAYRVYAERLEREQQNVRQTAVLNLATLEALARAIDAKDRAANSHLRRVQRYAAALAEAIGLSSNEIQGVQTAALLHDIGKLAVPEHILAKPGPLTQEEFEKVRIHPQVGAEIIAGVPFPYPVAPLILSHHERWDGDGYPRGLVGDDIPIGARILSVVDLYDSVTTARPYHPALSHESAVNLLRYEAGRALDPVLVRLFLDRLPALVAEFGSDGGDLLDGSTSQRVRLAAENSAFENIARAHHEIYALYEIAQAMGTSLNVTETMTLVSSKLKALVPWSGCALYLTEVDSDTLRCRFATGVDVTALLNTAIGPNEGPAGRVVFHRQTLVNVNPRQVFEAVGVTDEITLESALLCPLVLGDTLIGCLGLFDVQPSRYSEDHRRIIERVAEQAAAVIDNAMMFEQTHRASLTDPLTGLPNRRSMIEHLDHEIARADRIHDDVAVIVMDIDEFKSINDTCGHHVGDRALREVATALKAGLRPYDLCVRYAGDEFVIVLSQCSREAAEIKRRELQERLTQIALDVSGKVLHVRASAGVSIYPHDASTVDALLADADRRMYLDKTARRHAGTRQWAHADLRFADHTFEASVSAREYPPTVDSPSTGVRLS